MTKFNISIVSDNVCPWCYVGKMKLDRGISAYKASHPTDSFSITWRPFYLNPHAPTTSVPKREYYMSKFGEQRAAMIFERLGDVGKDVGINFSFGGRMGNTRDSHRIVQLGKTKGPEVQTKVVEELHAGYFENEKDITDHKFLKSAAVKAGLGEDEVEAWLESDKGGNEVDREVKEAQMKNIGGVPHFTVQDKYEVGGAQDSQAFVEIFEKIKAMEGS